MMNYVDMVRYVAENHRPRKLLKGVLLVIVVVVVFGFFLKKITNAKESGIKEGYKVVSDVPGVEFVVKKNMADISTAVMEISKNIDFIDYMTYSYKNGENTYLLFNIRQYIIIVQKGTSFCFNELGVEESLKINSMQGIWFTATGKPKENAQKYVIDVEAQVVITNSIYNDFYGTLCTITRDGGEWAMFVGTTREYRAEYEEMVEYIVDSFVFSDTVIAADVINHEVSMENGEIIDPGADVEPAETLEEPSEDIPGESSEVIPDEGSGESSESPQEEPAQTPEEVPEAEEHIASVEAGEESGLVLGSNQHAYEINEGSAYTSSIYAMLSVGDTGFMDVTSDRDGSYESAYVKVTRLYTQEETEQLISRYIASGDSYYSNITAPDGCHFEAVEYDIRYTGEETSYVNVKFTGLDGENLRFRGVKYPKMTHDILNRAAEKNGWVSGYICFYSVPNGCKEYALKFGDGNGNNDSLAAWYKIETD